ncbi:MAG: hypothetical protein NC331_14160 [Lachnospiraceae bacterium]|nr:hypothetical protein [Lachnospiraceae bacterium]MCM1240507.1 hypothetical protein [Lachnospiraceae bacterium]
MKAQFGKLLRNMAVSILGSALFGTLLLILVFCLPTEGMKRHVAVSTDVMLRDVDQGSYSGFAVYLQTKRESYTDAIMVQNAIERIPGKNVFEHAMWMYHNDLEEEVWTPEDSLKAYCAGQDTESMHLHEYSRYWHGYLVYLKPLLLVFSWKQISVMGVLMQFLLMAVAAALSVRKKQPGVAVAMIAGFLFMKPLLVLVSLTMTVCWVITLAALIFMLLKNDRLQEKKRYPEFFLMVGILTSYFDFLTYPIVTLGFPLCAFFLINESKAVRSRSEAVPALKDILQKTIGYSVCWGIGYAGMWAMKWIIADLTLHTGTIRDAIWSIIGRTEAIGGRPRLNGGFYVIGLNLQEYDHVIYPVMAAVIALVSLTLIIAACRKKGMGALIGLIPYMLVFCIPFVWIIAVQHHSALHARFTFRIIAVAALAVGCMGIQAWKEISKK